MRVALPLIGLLALGFVLMLPSVSAADAPTWTAGDYWRLENSKNYLELKVVGEGSCQGTPAYDTTDGGAPTYIRKSDLAFLDRFSCAVDLDLLDFPMNPGMTYNCIAVTSVIPCRIGPMQSVSTVAGTFDALPVMIDSSGSGSFVNFAYYAPAVGYLVKLDDGGGDPFELYSYKYGTNWGLIIGFLVVIVIIILVVAVLVVRSRKKAKERAALIPPAPGYPTVPGVPGGAYSPYGGYSAYPQYQGYQGYAVTGYPQPGYPQASYPQAAYQQTAYPQTGYPQAAAPQAGYPGYPQAQTAAVTYPSQPQYAQPSPYGSAPSPGVAPAVPSAPRPPTPTPSYGCATCGKPLRHIAAYSRWYCDNCKKYA